MVHQDLRRVRFAQEALVAIKAVSKHLLGLRIHLLEVEVLSVRREVRHGQEGESDEPVTVVVCQSRDSEGTPVLI